MLVICFKETKINGGRGRGRGRGRMATRKMNFVWRLANVVTGESHEKRKRAESSGVEWSAEWSR